MHHSFNYNQDVSSLSVNIQVTFYPSGHWLEEHVANMTLDNGAGESLVS